MTTRYEVAPASLAQSNVAPSAVTLPLLTAKSLTLPGFSFAVAACAAPTPMPVSVRQAASARSAAQASALRLNFSTMIVFSSFPLPRERLKRPVRTREGG